MVEVLSGQAAAQRSVIAEHRSESAARADAATERQRLQVIYGEGAGVWRVVVIHDGEVIAEERPSVLTPPLEPPSASPPPEEDEPPAAPGAEGDDPSNLPRERDPEPTGPVPEWVIAKVEASIARSRDRERRSGEGG